MKNVGNVKLDLDPVIIFGIRKEILTGGEMIIQSGGKGMGERVGEEFLGMIGVLEIPHLIIRLIARMIILPLVGLHPLIWNFLIGSGIFYRFTGIFIKIR